MKSLIYRILLFCIPILGFILFTEICVRNFPSIYGAKKEQLATCKDSVQLLILGGSSAMDGIDPTQFSVYAYNLAFAAQPLYFDIKLTEKYVAALPRLKYVVIPVSYVSLSYEGSGLAFFYNYYFDIDYKGQKFWRERFLQSFFVHNSTQVRYMLSHSFVNRPEYNLKQGWTSFHTSDLEDVTSDEKGWMRAEHYKNVVNEYKGGDAILKDLEAFIVFLQSRNITPILVSVPNYATLRKYLDESRVEKDRQAYESLAEKYNIIFLDLFADEYFTAEDFHNADHLNEKGAVKLARKIDARIMEYKR